MFHPLVVAAFSFRRARRCSIRRAFRAREHRREEREERKKHEGPLSGYERYK